MDSTATFEVAVSGGEGNYTYQWYKVGPSGRDRILSDDTYYSGTQTKTLTCKNIGLGSGKYYCIVTSFGKSIHSDTATLTVTMKVDGPKSVTVSSGGTAFFDVTVSGGNAPYTYQWHEIRSGSDTAVENDGDWYSGAKTNRLCVDKVSGAAQYYCVITDANGNKVNSPTASLRVN